MKLGIFTDPHCCNVEILCKTRRPSLSIAKIREAMERFAAEHVDACICLGDLTDHGIPYITLPAMCEGEENSYRVLNLP